MGNYNCFGTMPVQSVTQAKQHQDGQQSTQSASNDTSTSKSNNNNNIDESSCCKDNLNTNVDGNHSCDINVSQESSNHDVQNEKECELDMMKDELCLMENVSYTQYTVSRDNNDNKNTDTHDKIAGKKIIFVTKSDDGDNLSDSYQDSQIDMEGDHFPVAIVNVDGDGNVPVTLKQNAFSVTLTGSSTQLEQTQQTSTVAIADNTIYTQNTNDNTVIN